MNRYDLILSTSDRSESYIARKKAKEEAEKATEDGELAEEQARIDNGSPATAINFASDKRTNLSGATIKPNGKAAIGSEVQERKMRREEYRGKVRERLGNKSSFRFPDQDAKSIPHGGPVEPGKAAASTVDAAQPWRCPTSWAWNPDKETMHEFNCRVAAEIERDLKSKGLDSGG